MALVELVRVLALQEVTHTRGTESGCTSLDLNRFLIFLHPDSTNGVKKWSWRFSLKVSLIYTV